MTYWPPKSDWARCPAESKNLDPSAVEAAKQFAVDNESEMNRDIHQALVDGHFSEPPPINEIVGPTRPREEPAGVIIRDGEIVSEWGDVDRVDMTFSASKSYLSICAGLAVDEGLIPDINAPVRELVDDGGFSSDQNRDITWAQLLQLTSEWEGELWGKPDWIDHNRQLGSAPGQDNQKGQKREMQKPGTHWEYNDVRVNRLALALLRVWRKPLPEVLRERIMDPIGASDTWEWHGYSTSYVEIDGQKMQSVSGGAHWGGGIFISTLDHARVGLLMLNRGNWNGRQLLSEKWVDASTTPCPLNKNYGYMWWLNQIGEQAPSAPRSSFFAKGVGANIIWIAPEQNMVSVVRWLQRDAFDGYAGEVMKAFR